MSRMSESDPNLTAARPAVLVPALLCDRALYAEMLGHLGAVLAPQVSVAVQPRIESSAAAILRDAPERFVLVGASYGANVALAIALSAPQRVQALVLAACDARAQPAGGQDLAAAMRAAPQAVLDTLAGLVVREDHKTAADIFRQMAARIGFAQGAAQATASFCRPDFQGRLHELTMPVLLLWGADDPIMPLAQGQELAAKFPNARLVVLPECGHLPTLERPAECADAIDGFLRRALAQ